MTAIIVTGRKRGGPRQIASYLTANGENESVRVRQVSGFVAKDVQDALLEMWALADGCKAKDFLYHVSINPRKDAKLTQKQWRQAVDTLEKNLNLVGHQRVVVEHIKDGRTHYHIVWNRVNPLTGRIKKLSFDHRVCRATALQLGDLFKLEPTANKGQSFKRGELKRGKRTGIDPRAVKAEVTALWNKAKSGKEFTSSLAKHGYILAKGDRNQFVIVDKAGSVHGLTRRINGATVKTVRRGLADIDRASIPTIAEARRRIKAVQRRPASSSSARMRIMHGAAFITGALGKASTIGGRNTSRGNSGSGNTGGKNGAINKPSGTIQQPVPKPQAPLASLMPASSGNLSGMCEAQRLDFIAACDGKITWREYFRKWGKPEGGLRLSL